jgi:phytoene desaturase
VILLLRLKALTRHWANIGRYFQDERLKFAFIFQNLYMGLNPFTAPAIYSLMPYLELSEGIWYPKGGMNRISEALVAIAEQHGVEIVYNAPVQQILTNGTTTVGVKLQSGETLPADLLVANADLSYVYRQLLPDDRAVQPLMRKKYGCSALSFFWGLHKSYPQLSAHNLFMAPDIQHGFEVIFDQASLTTDPSFYLHAPTRIDPTMAPAGQDALVISVPVPHLNKQHPQDWQVITDQSRRYILQRLAQVGLQDLETQIKFEIVYGPPDWHHRYNLTHGSAHGLGHEIFQMGYMRPHNRHAKYKNLYFVGASTHPGTGLPSVLLSAKFAANRIVEEW